MFYRNEQTLTSSRGGRPESLGHHRLQKTAPTLSFRAAVPKKHSNWGLGLITDWMSRLYKPRQDLGLAPSDTKKP